MNEAEFTAHEKFLLFNGMMMTMAMHIKEFRVEQIREMNCLSDESRANHGQDIDKTKSAEVVMSLARRLCK